MNLAEQMQSQIAFNKALVSIQTQYATNTNIYDNY